MRIFHVALRSDWEAARRAGAYTVSTRGRTLAEEGFVHASRADQWPGVRERFYADVAEPLVLLVIDPDRLGSPMVDESPPDAPAGGETFPHVYGPIDLAAVVQVVPLDGEGNPPADSFSRLFLRELMTNAALGLALVVLVAAAARTGLAVDEEWGALVGALAGLLVGVPAVVLARRRLG
ncbi:MAG TPA: DUF952 domain-containing protein [Glycomyces sp.]|nr:DUF952 domain-containing protein [Glycomyces sp.]